MTGNPMMGEPFCPGAFDRGAASTAKVCVGDHVRRGYSPTTLTAIYEESVNLVVWERRQATEHALYAGLLATHWKGFGFRAEVPFSDGEAMVRSRLPELAGKEAVVADIVLLMDLFCTLFELDSVGLRVTSLSSAMCPRFHSDNVPCRLICAYGDGGTQWLPEHAVDRSRLGAASAGLGDEASGVYDRDTSIRQLAAAHVALLKGDGWEGNRGRGLVHRSPPIRPPATRLLVTLDFL